MAEIERLRAQFRKTSPVTPLEAEERIAQITRIPRKELKREDIASLNNQDFPQKKRDALYAKYGLDGITHTEKVHVGRFHQYADIYLGGEFNSNSYGIFGPSYRALLKGVPSHEDRNESGKALLVGALTPETIQEFSLTVKEAYPQTKTYVIDVIDGGKAQDSADFADFARANALHMPFKDKTFDTIHTNILLPYLYPEDNPIFEGQKGRVKHVFDRIFKYRKFLDPKTRRVAFYEEAFRTLRDNGALLMVEEGNNPLAIEQELEEAGFGQIEFFDIRGFKQRASMNKYYAGFTKKVTSSDIATFRGGFAIRAYKSCQ